MKMLNKITKVLSLEEFEIYKAKELNIKLNQMETKINLNKIKNLIPKK